MKIEKMLIKYNKTALKNRNIKYIIIHDTGNTGKGSGVDNHFKYFNGGNRKASADFFVDDKKIGQFTDYKNEYAWHVGDGKGKKGITNANSLGIEICINSDGDYQKAFDKAIELTRYLMKELNISIDNVKRHYDASGKACPNSMKPDRWKKWNEFKKELAKEPIKEPVKEEPKPQPKPEPKPQLPHIDYYVKVNVDVLNVRRGRTTGHQIIGKLIKGQKVKVARDMGDGWLSIYFGDKGGFISAKYVERI